MRTLPIVLALAALAAFAGPARADHLRTIDGIDLDSLITDEDLDVGEEMCARPR